MAGRAIGSGCNGNYGRFMCGYTAVNNSGLIIYLFYSQMNKKIDNTTKYNIAVTISNQPIEKPIAKHKTINPNI